MSWGLFDQETDRLAGGLLAHGLEPGSRIALWLDNRDATTFYQVLFAAYKAGVVPVPVNARLVPSELQDIVEDCGAQLVVVGRDHEDELDSVPIKRWTSSDIEEIKAGGEPHFRLPTPTDRADILYTSGTTGRPKGAVFRHRALSAHAQLMAATLRLVEGDVYQTAAPCYTSTGVRTCPLPVLFTGGTFVVEDSFDVEKTADRLDSEAANAYFGVPAMFTLLVEKLAATRQFPSVTSILFGGSPMPIPTLERIPERFPNAGLWNMYGLTEAGPNGCVLPPEHARSHPDSVGFPLAETDLKIVREDGRPAGPSEPGEIVIRAETLMEGYLNRPKETALAIREGWLHTGDVGIIDEDGFVSIVDRKNDMIIRGGFNVYPAEVEAALLEHRDILEAAVVGIPHPVLGEDIAAAVVFRPGHSPSVDELSAHCSSRVADFKRPRVYRVYDQLPRSTMGKLLRRELRAEMTADTGAG
jgi:acyl-CoA synthetase (AMP-forming)/AMP-acid ligase II